MLVSNDDGGLLMHIKGVAAYINSFPLGIPSDLLATHKNNQIRKWIRNKLKFWIFN